MYLPIANTVDREIFAELYFCVFHAFNFRHPSDRRKLNNGEIFAIYGSYDLHELH